MLSSHERLKNLSQANVASFLLPNQQGGPGSSVTLNQIHRMTTARMMPPATVSIAASAPKIARARDDFTPTENEKPRAGHLPSD